MTHSTITRFEAEVADRAREANAKLLAVARGIAADEDIAGGTIAAALRNASKTAAELDRLVQLVGEQQRLGTLAAGASKAKALVKTVGGEIVALEHRKAEFVRDVDAQLTELRKTQGAARQALERAEAAAAALGNVETGVAEILGGSYSEAIEQRKVAERRRADVEVERARLQKRLIHAQEAQTVVAERVRDLRSRGTDEATAAAKAAAADRAREVEELQNRITQLENELAEAKP